MSVAVEMTSLLPDSSSTLSLVATKDVLDFFS